MVKLISIRVAMVMLLGKWYNFMYENNQSWRQMINIFVLKSNYIII
jgi:hypothetical protein